MNIVVLIPCFNEALTITSVINDFKKELPNSRIIVFDNSSTDATKALALSSGAEVVPVIRKGKANVVREMFKRVKADIYVLVDGDGTYSAKDVHELIKPIQSGEIDMVVGRRTPVTDAAMKTVNKIGNILFSRFLNFCFHAQLQDVLSGYRAFNREFVRRVPIITYEFEIEIEMTLQAFSKGLGIVEVPVSYKERPSNSYSKLKPFRDGYLLLLTIVILFRDLKPLRFFGIGAIAVWIVAALYGSWVYYLPRAANLFDTIFLTSLAILGWLFLLIGFSVHTINRRFDDLTAILDRNLLHKETD
ncbi:MAG: glycosyltransferase [Candidatus Omnitrophota bacterium]